MNIGIAIKLAGFISIIFISASFITGLFLRKLRMKITHHKILAGLGVGFAIVHFLIILIVEYILV